MSRPPPFDLRSVAAAGRFGRRSSLCGLACGIAETASAMPMLLPGARAGVQPWQFTLLCIISIALLVLGGLVLRIGLAHPRSRQLALLGLAALACAACLAPAWWTLAPFADPSPLQGALWAAALALTILFLLRATERATQRWQGALLLQGLLLTIVIAVSGASAQRAAQFLGLAMLLQLAFALAWELQAGWAERRADAWAVLTGLTLTLGIGIAHARWPAWPDPFLLQSAAPVPASAAAWSVLLIVLGLRQLGLLSQTLVAAEASRDRLEARLRDVTVEVERNFTQLAELRVEQVAEQERKRIAADLHDDLGAKLLTIVHTSDNERIATLGREALDEMRLSVRGLSGRPMPLGDAMADWRAETVQRLAQTNIRVDWHGVDEEVNHLLPTRAYVQTTRILREAVSNIIKHSGASHCEVHCIVGERRYGLVIEDNGRGMASASEAALERGHGLANMKHRARQLQGQCLVESAPGVGTVIWLSLPL